MVEADRLLQLLLTFERSLAATATASFRLLSRLPSKPTMALNVDGSISYVEGRDDVDDEEQSRYLLLLREKNNVRFISFFFTSLNLSLFSSSLRSEEVERERQLEGAAVADLFDDGEVCLRCRRRPWRIEGEVDDDKIWCIKCVKVFAPRRLYAE